MASVGGEGLIDDVQRENAFGLPARPSGGLVDQLRISLHRTPVFDRARGPIAKDELTGGTKGGPRSQLEGPRPGHLGLVPSAKPSQCGGEHRPRQDLVVSEEHHLLTGVDSGSGTDMDSNGSVGISDFNLFLPGFRVGLPGPSGLVPDGDGGGVSPDGGDCRDGDAQVFPGAPVVVGSLDPSPTVAGYSRGVCFDARVGDGQDPRATDGCSSPAGNNPTHALGGCPSAAFGSVDPDAPLPCDLHDACLGTCGSSRAECDQPFLLNMLAVCDTLPPSEAGCVDPCRAWAGTYFAAVTLPDEDGYLDGQARHCACVCDADTPSCGNGVCEVDLGESAGTCADCPGVADGGVCVRDIDCASGQCGPRGRCTTCGNGSCETGEGCLSGGISSCQADCGKCPHGNACDRDADCAGFCDALGFCAPKVPNGTPCLKDAACQSGNCSLGFCTARPFCGDLSCNNGETCSSCGIDCGICPFCGDFSCNNGETCSTCAFDRGDCCQPPGKVCLVGSD